MEVRVNALTPELFLELYTSVGWEPPSIEQVAVALTNTLATFTLYDGSRAVGMARLIGDGGMSFYIKDFAVMPIAQAHGAGSLLLETMERYIRQLIGPKAWAVSLELISTPKAVPFYKKHGFEERPCEWDGPGMFKMIREREPAEAKRAAIPKQKRSHSGLAPTEKKRYHDSPR